MDSTELQFTPQPVLESCPVCLGDIVVIFKASGDGTWSRCKSCGSPLQHDAKPDLLTGAGQPGMPVAAPASQIAETMIAYGPPFVVTRT